MVPKAAYLTQFPQRPNFKSYYIARGCVTKLKIPKMLYSSQKAGFDVSNVSSKKPLEDPQGFEIILVWARGPVCLGGGVCRR
jgi:hypothetical protein